MHLIELQDITKIYGSGNGAVTALKHINLTVDAGELVAVMGKSGCGKSTLLNVIGALDSPTGGEYFLNGDSISEMDALDAAKFRQKNIGFVVQQFALINDYTIYENIALPLRYKKLEKKEIDTKVKTLLEKFGLSDKARKRPSQLSGGQCQRTAIARAIACEPQLILADEPTGALDESTGNSIMDIFRELNGNGHTILIVTHEKAIAEQCQRIVHMQDGTIIL